MNSPRRAEPTVPGKREVTWPYAPPAGMDPFHQGSGTPVVYDHKHQHVAKGAHARAIRMQDQQKEAAAPVPPVDGYKGVQWARQGRSAPREDVREAMGMHGKAYFEHLMTVGDLMYKPGIERYRSAPQTPATHSNRPSWDPHNLLGKSGDLLIATESPMMDTSAPPRYVDLHSEWQPRPHQPTPAPTPSPAPSASAACTPSSSGFVQDPRKAAFEARARARAEQMVDPATREAMVREEVHRMQASANYNDVDIPESPAWDAQVRYARHQADGYYIPAESPGSRTDGLSGAAARAARAADRAEKQRMGIPTSD